MSSMAKGVRMFALLLATLLLSACPDDGRLPTEAAPPVASCDTGEVTATQWVQATTDIAKYRVCPGDADNRVVKLKLLNDTGSELAAMRVQMPSKDGSVQANLTLPNGHELHLTSRGSLQSDGYINHMRLTDGTQHVGIQSSHRFQNCYLPPSPALTNPDKLQPDCTKPVPLSADAYSVPACGPVNYGLSKRSLATKLRSLIYIQDNPAAFPATGVTRWHNGTRVQSRIQVLDGNNLTAKSAVSNWLGATGANAIIGTPAEELLTAAMQDYGWRNYVNAAWAKQNNPILRVAGNPVNATATAACLARPMRVAGVAVPDKMRAALCGFGSWLDALADAFGLGDPHMSTYDGLHFDFMGAGAYTLVKSLKDDLEIQARMQPLPNPALNALSAQDRMVCKNVSYFTAVALRYAGTTISIHVGAPFMAIYVNGVQVADEAALASALPTEITLQQSDNALLLLLDDGSRLAVESIGKSLGVRFRAAQDRRGSLAGIFGTFTGDRRDDLRLNDGTALSTPPATNALYNQFGEAWRITSKADSLLHYSSGEDISDFYRSAFPPSVPRVEDLSATARADAQAKCKDVVGQPQHSWCVLDTVCMAESYAAVYEGMSATGARMTPAVDPADANTRFVVVNGALLNQSPDSVAATDTAHANNTCRIYGVINNILFAEALDHTLTSPIAINASNPGTYASNANLAAGSIPAGTAVDVWFIHIPKIQRTQIQFASARFSGEILGVATSAANLDATDHLGSATGLSYPSGASDRGYELSTNNFQISDDKHELRLNMGATGTTGVDQIRVFVAAP